MSRVGISGLALLALLALLAGCAPLGSASMPAAAQVLPASATPTRLAAELPLAGAPLPNLADSQPDENPGGGAQPAPGRATPTAGTEDSAAPTALPPTPTPAPLPTWSPRQTGPVSALLYLTQDRLMLWDPRDPGVLPIAEGVTAFTASANGQVVAYLRARQVAANGLQRFDLALYNLQTAQTVTLLQESPALPQVALSPEGDWVAYRVDVEGGPIYALPVSQDGQPGSPIRLGACRVQATGDCSRLDWAAQAEGLVWSDSQGIWLAEPKKSDGAPARLVHPAEVPVVDPKGKTAHVGVHFSQPDWYQGGRFVLLHVQPTGSSVTWYALLDTLKGQIAEVPDSYGATPDDSFARWLPDGTLLVAHTSDPLRRIPPYVRLVRVTPTSPELLLVYKRFDLYSEAIPFSDSTRKIIPTHSVDWPGYPQAGRMPLGISLIGSDMAPVLFQLELQFGRLEKLAELPADVVQIYWSPDGRHGLLINSGGKNVRLLALPAPGQAAFYDLLPILGAEAHSFLWLAARLRP